MTNSERICNEVGQRFFCKDFVYSNLTYFNSDNNKVELCDGLFEYACTYLILQIKERNKNKRTKSDENWLKDKVYGKAVQQIRATIDGIRNNKITIRDGYNQEDTINSDFLLYPVIVFDNPQITDYKKTVSLTDKKIKISVFSLNDYEVMMNVCKHPYDILAYLKYRCDSADDTLPGLFIGEGDTTTIMANINSESDFAESIIHFMHIDDVRTRPNSLALMRLISLFKEKQNKNIPHYKTILRILQAIEPSKAPMFMECIEQICADAKSNIFKYSKIIGIVPKPDSIMQKSIGIVFFSIGDKPLEDAEYYNIIADMKRIKYDLDIVVIISCVANNDGTVLLNWYYNEAPDDRSQREYFLKMYRDVGLFSNISKEYFENVCSHLIYGSKNESLD